MNRTPLAALLALASLARSPPAPTKAAACRVDGLLPDRACTPGAVATTDLAVICHTSTRGRREVSRQTRRAVFVAYGLPPREPSGAYEVDHLIPLELGGSNDARNLWPEAAPGYHDKDRLENELHANVCAGAMALAAAQRAIASDWTTIGGH